MMPYVCMDGGAPHVHCEIPDCEALMLGDPRTSWSLFQRLAFDAGWRRMDVGATLQLCPRHACCVSLGLFRMIGRAAVAG